MIATIRVHDNGESSFLCNLDLMKFTEEQVRERMDARGIQDDAFFVCGFSDWGIDSIMDLSQAYLLKRAITDLYDNDDFLIQEMLKKHWSVAEIISKEYIFVAKDDEEAMKVILKDVDSDKLIHLFFQCQNTASMVLAYIEQGYLLNTSKGFYLAR